MKNEAYTAVLILQEVLEKGHSLTHAFEKNLLKNVAESDISLIKEICFGVLRFYNTLQAYLKTALKKPFKKDDQDIEFLILIGAYQLLYLERAEHAVIFNTVATVSAFKKIWAKNIVNAILRKFQRDKSNFPIWLAAQAEEIRYAHPIWLIDQIKSSHPFNWKEILEQNNERPPLVLRARERVSYLEDLKKTGIEAVKIAGAPQAIGLLKGCAVSQLPGFYEGLCSVQDTAAQYAAYFLDLKPGQRVLDACAAPGGKTTHILELEPQLKELIAIDIDAGRVEKIKDNLKRCQLNATVLAADATQPNSWWDGGLFDRILLDAPCSGTAVIRRHPDIKWLRRPEDIGALHVQQVALLKALWPLLKPGGRLIYVTCSLLQEENEQVIEEFVQVVKSVEKLNISRDSPESNEAFHPDYFYYCGLLKR